MTQRHWHISCKYAVPLDGLDDILVDGREAAMDIAPFIDNARTFIPVRFVAENLGFRIEWIGSLSRVIIVYYLPDIPQDGS